MKLQLDPELIDGLKRGALIGAGAAVLAIAALHAVRARTTPAAAKPVAIAAHVVQPPMVPHTIVVPAPVRKLDFAGQSASPDARRLAQWVVDSNDNRGLNFAILDKKNARVFVFEPGGRLRGATPVLLGYAVGDDSVAGIGQRPIAQVRPSERTTPAGRFVAEPGRNAIGEDVVWVDYAAAVSMHRVRVTNPKEHRLERLASPSPADNRISYGCINMPVAFFETVLWPHFKGRRGIVYVLPEVRPLTQVFPALAASPAA